MPAHFISMGDPAHEAERQALAFLKENLTRDYTVYGNPLLVDREGQVFELDAVVVAPHGIYVVEVKCFRGQVEGTDTDWYVPHPVRSPVRLNRKTAQILKSAIQRENYESGKMWVQGLVFLSAATHSGVKGPISRDRVHTRKTIIAALQDEDLLRRLSGRRVLARLNNEVENAVVRVIGSKTVARPSRRIREFEITDTLERGDRFTEYLAKNQLQQEPRVLRVYPMPELASPEEQARVEDRARWEAQVLGRLGRCPQILRADMLFADEETSNVVLPLEHFPGVALHTWLQRHGPTLAKQSNTDNLRARVNLWLKVSGALRHAHDQGVVHRLLRPEVVLIQDASDTPDLRVTGFDLAKQMHSSQTVMWTTINDERLQFAAPEVVNAFSEAQPASDQFSLGALLGLMLTGRDLFDSTRELIKRGRLMIRVRDINPRVRPGLDEAVTRMLALRATDRFPSLEAAEDAVRAALEPGRATGVLFSDPATDAPDPDDLQPGTRVGPDYEIKHKLGEGGLAVVYAARHLVSGRMRALKIARKADHADEALRGEFEALSRMDHRSIVNVVDLSRMVEDRLTLVMERVSGTTLRRWLVDTGEPDPNTQRRFAEDLMGALEYLEQQGITHKDLKPDNLLVGDDGLTVIDFSLVEAPDDAPFGGTAMYRDPGSVSWSHATDRYAAALCLFELYAGRHAFDGRAPEPGEQPRVTEQDIDPAGLASFFVKALDPNPGRRFPSIHALREAFVAALGEQRGTSQGHEVPAVTGQPLDADTPLRRTHLSNRAVTQLSRSRITTVGELLALDGREIRSIHAIGTKTAREIIAFAEELRLQGIQPAPARPLSVDPPLYDDLARCVEPLQTLALKPALLRPLLDAGYGTVGLLAAATRSEVLRTDGIGAGRLAKILEAMADFSRRTPLQPTQTSLDQLWDTTSRPLSSQQRIALERHLGLLGEPETQGAIGEDLGGMSQGQVSRLFTEAMDRLDRGVMSELEDALEALLDGFGGVTLCDDVGLRLEQQWGAGQVRGAGVVRLLCRLHGDNMQLLEGMDGVEGAVLARPRFSRAELVHFLTEAWRLAQQWPPEAPDSTARTLQAALPHYKRDPTTLAVTLYRDILFLEGGELFIPPVDPEQSLGLVLDRERLPVSLARLEQRVEETFDGKAPFPARDHLLEVLGRLGYQVRGDQVAASEGASVLPDGREMDPLPAALGPERSHEQVVADMLREAACSRGFRLLVTPPEHHADIGPTVARALEADGQQAVTWLSFEDQWFRRHQDGLQRMERAERFAAQRRLLTRSVAELVQDMLDEHGRHGRTVVLGDTGLWGLCDALDQIRLLYDETMSGERGFWVLVIPGILHDKQPLFNEKHSVWHLEGATMPLLRPVPVQ